MIAQIYKFTRHHQMAQLKRVSLWHINYITIEMFKRKILQWLENDEFFKNKMMKTFSKTMKEVFPVEKGSFVSTF